MPTLPRTNNPLVGAVMFDDPILTPPLTVKAELAVVIPIPTLPDTAKPEDGPDADGANPITLLPTICKVEEVVDVPIPIFPPINEAAGPVPSCWTYKAELAVVTPIPTDPPLNNPPLPIFNPPPTVNWLLMIALSLTCRLPASKECAMTEVASMPEMSKTISSQPVASDEEQVPVLYQALI